MASTSTEQPKLHASDVLSLSDAELDRVLHKIIPADRTDATYIDLRDLADLPKPDQLTVMQRIKDWVHSAKSRPVDLDQVTSRLVNASASVPPRSPSWSPSPGNVPTPEDVEEAHYQDCMRAEVDAYDDLIADGGRPWYPFHLLDHISKDPGKYHDILRFWCSGDRWLVYTQQLGRWQKFRMWQRDNRGDLDVQAEVEREKAYLIRIWVEGGDDLSKIDTEEQWAQHYESVKNRRGWQHRYTVEKDVVGKKGEARFPAYVQAMRARLDRHGFSRPVQLDQDHQQQDPLITWIEYLNYEYWIRDGFADKATKLQTQYETSLRELMDANVLLPGETSESVCEFHHGFVIQREKRLANEAVEAAETAVSVVEKALDNASSDIHRQVQEAALARARERLKKAVEAEDAVKKRSELIFKFGSVNNPFTQSKQQAENHQILLQWVLDQVPLIEAEMAEARAGTSSSQKGTRADSGELELEEPATKRHEPGTTPTAQDMQPERNRLPEPPAQSSTRPSRKRSREDDSEGESVMPDTKKQKPSIQPNPEVEAKPKIQTTRSKHTQDGQNHEEPNSGAQAKQVEKPSTKAAASPRQPESRKDSPEQSASPPPPALQKQAPISVHETTSQQATLTSSATPSLKPTPAPSKRKRAEEEEPPQRSQQKRRRGGR